MCKKKEGLNRIILIKKLSKWIILLFKFIYHPMTKYLKYNKPHSITSMN